MTVLKDNKFLKLPRLDGGSFSGMDRLLIPHNLLSLKKVEQREDNLNIDIITQAVDGPEEVRGGIKFIDDDRRKKDVLFSWLQQQVGKNIEAIYNSEFSFGSQEKICPICGSGMFQSMEPKVANLANTGSKFPNQIRYWRCSNNNCGYKEKYEI